MSDWRFTVLNLAYFVSAFLFIFGLKRMSTPPTARSGNTIAALAMGLALVATFLDPAVRNLGIIGLGLLIGAAVGIFFGRTVKMTAMPQMVALFNGTGGGTAALVSIAEFMKRGHADSMGVVFSAVLGAIIGALSFTGSIVAFAKLQELLSDRPLRFPGQMLFNGLLTAVTLLLGTLVVTGSQGTSTLVLVTLLAGLLGALVVLPIGGADMPVVIALLNSATGIAAALTGFVLENQILIVAGALVGASGTLLTILMARAMNRPISNVLFSGFGTVSTTALGNGRIAGSIKEASADDVAVALVYSRNVVIVPGYGLAVAQAQQTVRELSDELAKRGVSVRYAIHPVAGRMPGHMNVVLADANVPYEQLSEMDSINGEFPNTDVVLVIGANDVVNPAARTDPSSPIYGMPILDVDRAKNVIVLKRSMNPGFAGIDNELFYRDNTRMLFGDARASLNRLVTAVKLN
jgi:proton-translocating NAD(P)+ transhydrogenase subunit beta